jgi:hypothetical protein
MFTDTSEAEAIATITAALAEVQTWPSRAARLFVYTAALGAVVDAQTGEAIGTHRDEFSADTLGAKRDHLANQHGVQPPEMWNFDHDELDALHDRKHAEADQATRFIP